MKSFGATAFCVLTYVYRDGIVLGQNLKSSLNFMLYVFIGDKACTSNFEIKFTTLVSLSVTLEAKIGQNTI